MRRTTVWLSALVLVLLATAPVLAVTQGRIMGKVVDEEGNPIPDVTIEITTPELDDYRDTVTTNKKGRFTAVFLDATKNYLLEFKKKGYRSFEEPVKPQPGGNLRMEFEMPSYRAEPAQETDEIPTGAAAAGLTEAQKTFNEGVAASQAGNVDEALAKFEQAAELDPDLQQAHIARGNLYLTKDQPEKAAEAAEAALAIDPEETRAVEVAYDAYQALGDEEKAEKYLEELKNSGIDVSARLYNSGVAALRLGDYSTAERKFKAAVAENPELEPAYSALAVVLINEEKFGEALEAADRTLELNPDNRRAKRMRYQALRLLDRLDEAAEAFQALPEEDRIEALNLQFNKATELFNAGQTQEAVDILEDVVAAEPSHARAHYMLGLSFTNLGQNDQARAHFEKFVELAPEDPDAATAKEMLQYLGS